ncbi:MAG: hypothetical protein LBT16_00725 [Treponema sp.]|jgi:hypothetical protein|nr:hypothetical protein [Treponema sp.]
MASESRVSRLRLVPQIRRAREFRLYTAAGGRLTDLWQDGGRAVLGHTPPAVLRELKNTSERGLFAPFSSHLEGRFFKALSVLFPGRGFRVYQDEASLRRALCKAGFLSPEDGPFPDPAFTETEAGDNYRPMLWRPFLADGQPLSSLLIPILPWPLAPRALVLDKSLEASFPPPEFVSPVILAASARAVYDLASSSCRAAGFPKITRVLSQDGRWRRRGIYLSLASPGGEDDYTALFRRFLEKGFLLPPGPEEPLILPGTLSPGEETKLADLLGTP